METTNIRLQSNIKADIVEEIGEIIESYADEYIGIIIIDLDKIVVDETKLDKFGKWQQYCRKTKRKHASDYITEWSPNNRSEISEVCETNDLLQRITDNWYDYTERYQEVSIIDILEDTLLNDLPESYGEFNESLEEILVNPDKYNEDLVNDIDEVISLCYNRNPKFKVDW